MTPRPEQLNALNAFHANVNAEIERIVKEHTLTVNALTEKQLVELLKQLFASGDIIRQTMPVGPRHSEAQSVIYIPFAREQELSGKLEDIRKFCTKQHERRLCSYRVLCDCLECVTKRTILEML